MNTPHRSFVPFVLSASLALVACGKRDPSSSAVATAAPAPPGSAKAARDDVVVTVNGVAITDADVKLKLKGDMHGAEGKPLHRKNAAESVVRQELVRQQALALGLDADVGYQQKLRQLEATMMAFQRAELGELYSRREVAAKAEVTEADAKAHFEANAKRIRTEQHVLQILRMNDEPGLLRDLEEIKKTSFEAVARKQFPGLPESQKPWDPGMMKWAQVPEAWRQALDGLAPGQTSGILRGPKGRAWIIKLADRRVDESVTFESVKGPVMDAMRTSRMEKLREDADRALREKASLVWVKSDAAAAPAASD